MEGTTGCITGWGKTWETWEPPGVSAMQRRGGSIVGTYMPHSSRRRPTRHRRRTLTTTTTTAAAAAASPPPPHPSHSPPHTHSLGRVLAALDSLLTSAPDVALGQAVEVGEVACLHELHHQVTRVRQAPGRRTRATLGEGRRRWPRSPPRPRPSTVGEGCTHSARHFSNWFFATSSLRPSSSFFVYYSRGVGE